MIYNNNEIKLKRNGIILKLSVLRNEKNTILKKERMLLDELHEIDKVIWSDINEK